MGRAQTISALTAPLLLPTAVAFDAQGNVYFAETNGHRIRRIDGNGVITTVAGNGTQGFSGDGGLATAAMLDSPAGLAVDAGGNVFVADSHNHRVRRIDAAGGRITTIAGVGLPGFGRDDGSAIAAKLDLPSALALDGSGGLYVVDLGNHRIRKIVLSAGTITTVAGNGRQGFAGDGGLATAAELDSPGGLAVDAGGNLYVADTHNQRVRKVTPGGLISTIAGTGLPGFAGDSGDATQANLARPRGLSVDTAGNVYLVDSNNQRVRRIASDGSITTVAGSGVQTLLTDGETALAAGLNTPQGLAVSPAGLLTFADTGNGRLLQISGGTAGTVGGSGGTAPVALLLTAPTTMRYGSGVLTAALTSSTPATGTVSFFESSTAGMNLIGTAVLVDGLVTLQVSGLSAGIHQIYLTYPGDATHAVGRSATSSLTITALVVSASAVPVSILYGQAVPPLSGSLQGILAQDTGSIRLLLSSAASTLSPVGQYPISGALSGIAAGNYTLSSLSAAAVTIDRAPSVVALSNAPSSSAGTSVNLSVQVLSTTSGRPTGSVVLFDGGSALSSVPLSSGVASFTTSGLAVGTHALTAVYGGDGNFLGSSTAASAITIMPGVAGDFTLASTGSAEQTVVSGSAASFTFAVQMQGAALSSPITLAASALPVGMTASFNPAIIPPGGAVSAFTLTVQTSKASAALHRSAALFAGLLGLLLPFSWRRKLAGSVMIGCLLLAGCGDRIAAAGGAALASYPITVSGTATTATGALLQHTALVTLSLK